MRTVTSGLGNCRFQSHRPVWHDQYWTQCTDARDLSDRRLGAEKKHTPSVAIVDMRIFIGMGSPASFLFTFHPNSSAKAVVNAKSKQQSSVSYWVRYLVD